jgi:hypothetical protein
MPSPGGPAGPGLVLDDLVGPVFEMEADHGGEWDDACLLIDPGRLRNNLQQGGVEQVRGPRARYL